MKSAAISKTRVQAKSSVSVSDKVAMGSVAAMGGISAVIGVWSVLCFAAALLTNGPIGMLKGAFTALTGI